MRKDKVEKCEDAATVIRECKETMQVKKKNIISVAYYQGKIFQKFKGKEKFVTMVINFNVDKYTINIVKLVNKHPKLKNSSLSLNFLKNI